MGEPLYLDVVTALNKAGRGDIKVVGEDTDCHLKTPPDSSKPASTISAKEEPKNNFTIGIVDDVTGTSLDYDEIDLAPKDQISCKIWGLGGDGTVEPIRTP